MVEGGMRLRKRWNSSRPVFLPRAPSHDWAAHSVVPSGKLYLSHSVSLPRGSILSSKGGSSRSLNAQPEKVHSTTSTHPIGQIKPPASMHSKKSKTNPISDVKSGKTFLFCSWL